MSSTITFSLIALKPDLGSSTSFLHTLKSLHKHEQPLWLGKAHHWIHEPHLSASFINPKVQKWDYLLITSTAPTTLPQEHISAIWSINSSSPAPLPPPPSPAAPLPVGWSSSNSSGLLEAKPHEGVELSLSTTSTSMSSQEAISLKDFTHSFGSETHPGPVMMFNLLSYLPNQRENYFKYISAFSESVGSKYGGEPLFLGFGVEDWSSKQQEEREGQEGKWEDAALISYPSIWHFTRMVDDEGYAEVDRKFKVGVIRDNPVLCCTEVKLGEVE